MTVSDAIFSRFIQPIKGCSSLEIGLGLGLSVLGAISRNVLHKMYTGFDMNCQIRKEKIDFDNNNNKNAALPIEWNRMAGADFVQGMMSVDLLTVSFFFCYRLFWCITGQRLWMQF